MEAPPQVFIDTPGTFLGKKSRRIVVRTPEGDRQEYPLLKLQGITVAGKGISLSTDLLYQVVKLGVRISFVDRLGRHYVTVASPVSYSNYRNCKLKEFFRKETKCKVRVFEFPQNAEKKLF